MVILAYGVEQPTTGDPGSVFFPALEHLCQRMSFHDHDGINSAPVSGTSVSGASVVALGAGFTQGVNLLWTQTIALPAGYTYANSMMQCRDNSTGEVIYCDISQASPTSVTISAIFNDLDVEVFCK